MMLQTQKLEHFLIIQAACIATIVSSRIVGGTMVSSRTDSGTMKVQVMQWNAFQELLEECTVGMAE